ncbi:MAG: penicillin-binding protein activator [Acidobacteriota bacterium]|jgi:branched-chain amino acid transport system substrate-binding protein
MKRTLSLSTCLLLALSFIRCGGQETVPVGAVLPLSGEFAIYGEPIRKGIDLAFEEIQARDDYPFQLELDVKDSQGDPERAAELLQQAYDAGSPAVIGGVTTQEAIEMVSVADRRDRVLLSPSASSPRLSGISTNFFRVFPSDFLEGTKMGHFARETLNVETAVIAASESPYAKGIQQVFRQELERRGGEVLDAIEYPRNTSDLGGVLDRIMTLAPDAVYLADYADGLVTLLAGLESRGYGGKILTTSSIASAEVFNEAGEAAEGVLFTQSNYDVDAEDEQIQRFVQAYREKYGSAPDLYAAHGYDAMRIYARALREGGRRPSQFWQGMRGISGFPGVTGTIQFDEQGDVQKFPRVYVIQEGQFVDYDKVLEERRRALEERRRALERRMRELERQRRALDEGGGEG